MAVPCLASGGESDERAAIAGLLRQTWEKPDAQLTVDPVVIAGEHAIADWRQGDHAGRALLRHTASGWDVVLCAGDALTERAFLIEAGVPAGPAATLADALAAAERSLPADFTSRLSRFRGVVRMSGH